LEPKPLIDGDYLKALNALVENAIIPGAFAPVS
jgi:hypothetical protein